MLGNSPLSECRAQALGSEFVMRLCAFGCSLQPEQAVLVILVPALGAHVQGRKRAWYLLLNLLHTTVFCLPLGVIFRMRTGSRKYLKR